MANNGCTFCNISKGLAEGEILYQDDLVTAFRDIHPVSPVHILIIPNKHLGSVNDANREDEPALGRLITVAKELANQEGIEHNGYRLIVNTGSHGGQVVSHLYMHLIGGRRMQHPIG